MSDSKNDKNKTTSNTDEYYFGGIKEFNLEEIEAEILNESIYLDVFAGSDIRLKKNIVPLKNCLAKLLQLKGVTYQWRTSDNDNCYPEIGFIAQEVEQVFPELVKSSETNGFLGVNYSKLTPILVETIKELNERINLQESKIAILEKKFEQILGSDTTRSRNSELFVN